MVRLTLGSRTKVQQLQGIPETRSLWREQCRSRPAWSGTPFQLLASVARHRLLSRVLLLDDSERVFVDCLPVA